MSAWADNILSIFPASVTSLKLRVFGATIDDAYYSLPALKTASAKVMSYVENDSYGRPQIAHAETLVIEATTMMSSPDNILSILGNIKRVHVKAVLDSGNTISTGLIATHSLDTCMGVDWEYTNTGGAENKQEVKFTFQLAITNAQALLAINGSPPADGTPDAGDILYTFASYAVATDQLPAGVIQVELGDVAGSYDQSFTTIEETSFTAKSVSDTPDKKGRSTPIAVEANVSAKLMQTGTAEVNNALVINQRLNKLQITLMTGTIVDLSTNVGCKFDPISSEGDISKKAVIPLSAMGTMLLSTWNGLWTS